MDNSPRALFIWVRNTLDESKLTAKARRELLVDAVEVIARAGLRGDICDAWSQSGYDASDISDFYP